MGVKYGQVNAWQLKIILCCSRLQENQKGQNSNISWKLGDRSIMTGKISGIVRNILLEGSSTVANKPQERYLQKPQHMLGEARESTSNST